MGARLLKPVYHHIFQAFTKHHREYMAAMATGKFTSSLHWPWNPVRWWELASPDAAAAPPPTWSPGGKREARGVPAAA